MYGYHSTNDNVLQVVYRAAQGGQTAAALAGFTPASGKLVNVDVSEQVKTQFEYQGNVRLA
ncbi:DUF726 domain-containing protein [Streptosporangium sp. NPDC087985]|uniref:DUF726 domain-containing protein n=1 Tax=Streptosporangium sp. NPDC087985 TaxID=3366196 RepID=UPI003826AAAB